MTDRPEELQRLDALQGATDLAHEAIFDMHRRLLERDPTQEESARLLSESARIATVEVFRLLAPLRALAARWDEESLLEPASARRTAREIETALASTEPDLAALLDRQRRIAARLRTLLG